jgi:site-specific DNA recombinase
MTTAFGYMRLSGEDQSFYSTEFQEAGIREYCKRHGIELKQILLDNGESSYTFERKAFKDMEALFKKHKADYLIVYHLDRFGRNMAEAMLKVKYFLDKGIKVRDISEPLDMDDTDMNTFMMRTMKFMAAETELHRIRARTQSGLRQAKLNGRFAGAAPYGYRNGRDEESKSVLIVEEEEATIVRKIFQLYIAGATVETIRKIVKEKGFKKTGTSTIQRMLANPVYAGLVHVPGIKNSPAQTVKGIHTALVTEYDYYHVQEKLNRKTVITQNREEVPLRGVLRCTCGALMTAGNSRNKVGNYFWYYVCRKGHKVNLSAIKIYKQFIELLQALSLKEREVQQIRIKLTEKMQGFLSNHESKEKEIRKRLSIVENKIQTAEERYLTGIGSEKAYHKVMTEMKTERARIYNELAQATTNASVYWERLEVVLNTLENVAEVFEKFSLEKKHQFINQVFNHSLNHDGAIYRTQKLHEVFRHKTNELKEKGLLHVDSPVVDLRSTLVSTGDES